MQLSFLTSSKLRFVAMVLMGAIWECARFSLPLCGLSWLHAKGTKHLRKSPSSLQAGQVEAYPVWLEMLPTVMACDWHIWLTDLHTDRACWEKSLQVGQSVWSLKKSAHLHWQPNARIYAQDYPSVLIHYTSGYDAKDVWLLKHFYLHKQFWMWTNP